MRYLLVTLGNSPSPECRLLNRKINLKKAYA
jgi:hypothetical protein